MTKNQIILGGITGILLLGSGGYYFLSSGNSAKTPSQQNNVNERITTPPQPQEVNLDIFKDSLLPQSEIQKLKNDNPELINILSSSQKTQQTKTIAAVNNSAPTTFVPMPSTPPVSTNKVITVGQANNHISYSGLNKISDNPNVQNQQLQQIAIQAQKQQRQNMELQRKQLLEEHKNISNKNVGNDKKVPPEHIAFLKDIKQKEFQTLINSLQIIAPSHPNREALEKNINSYKEYYAKLQNALNSPNVTYGMLLQHDEQHKKIVQQVSNIHKSFADYTSKLYTSQSTNPNTQLNQGTQSQPFQPQSVAPSPTSQGYNPFK